MAVFTRVCPSCARRVPQTVETCRCGTDLRNVVADLDTAAGPGSGRRQTLLWLTLVVVAAAAGIVFGLFWRKPAAAPAADAASAAPVVPASIPSAPAAPHPTAAADEAPASPPESLDLASRIPHTVMNPPPAPVAAPEAASFENVVTRVMPAIVLVETSAGRGSGFFVAPDTLLTNVHVVGRNSSVNIRRASGEVVPARVERTAADVDVALLKISSADPNQPTLTMGSTADARVGQEVFAIGSALGMFQNTVTRGIVSGIRQTGTATLVQTDAAVNPGNSGGPLIDRSGRVLGIITMGYTDRQGLNFAVGIDHASAVLGDARSASTSTRAPAPPPRADVPALSPAIESESELLRSAGLRAYDEALTRLARRGDALEGSWRNFRADCYEGRIVGTFDRDWFALFDQRTMKGAIPAGCATWFGDLRRDAEDVRSGVIAAEEAARRANVFPGVRREMRRKYRLDYPGWER